MVNQTLPLVSVITPSFNQGRFIRETIESVLTQDYANLEHIVVDGGSTDETLQILQEYSKRDSRFRFVSEPDNGQSHAINKGLRMAKGEIIGWLNSDDTYLPRAVSHAVKAFNTHSNWSMAYGNAYITNENNEMMTPYVAKPVRLKKLFSSCPICQPAVFLRKKVLDQLGGIDETLDFCMDYDLWIRIAKNGYEMGIIKNHYLANARLYRESKTGSKFVDVGFPEIIKTSKKHFGTVSPSWLNLFLKNYRNKGAFWYLTLFKSSSIFENSPKIKKTNLSRDSWAPHRLHASIRTHQKKPLHTLLVKGTQENFQRLSCSCFLNGRLIHRTHIDKGPFILQLPVYSHQSINNVELVCNTSFSSDMERQIYKVTDIVPLSEEEYEFFKGFEKGTIYVRKWINQNFNESPNLE
ncbi:glycosyltransferase family 2 protein [Priestia abyssalis]|uniref:glycosyltransferase family 2 protein n=1 Tax=Priestia abyssalis TaxID=1221450 RepID=UPI000994B667|nr:glycosyltransferase family 2 protein [Priestia abyssalis]